MFQIPRGTRDFTPEEMQKRKYLEDKIRTIFTNFGYREIQTPTFETLQLFTAKSGEGIIDEIYQFTDKGGRELALRPELTAPVMRFYVEKLQMEPKPLKLFYFGSCYRYDRPQKGRYREFTQAGCELIGVDTPEAYAELVALSYNILKNTGLKNIKLNIGNLTILQSIFKKLKIDEDKQKYLTPLIDKNQFEEVYQALVEFGIENKKIDDVIEILKKSDIKKIGEIVKDDEKAKNELTKTVEIINLLKNSFKIEDFELKLSIVRGLDYYKGLVFEIEAPALGAEKQLCGGGAYELINLFGGRQTPTTGFAIGFDRTIVALDSEKTVFPEQKIDLYVIPLKPELNVKAFEIVQKLREKGKSVDIDLMRRGVGKSMKYANSLNAKKVIIIGPKELEEDSVTVKDMVDGDQKLVKIKDIVDFV